MKFRKSLTIALLSLPIVLIVLLLVLVTIQNYHLKIKISDTNSKLAQAKIELESRNYNTAMGLYSDLIIADSEDYEAVLGMNSIYVLRKEFNKSIDLLTPYIESTNSAIQAAIADTYYQVNRYDEAAIHALKALNNDKFNEEAFIQVLKIINITLKPELIAELSAVLDFDTLNESQKLKYFITSMNFEDNNLAELIELKNSLTSEMQYIVNTYEDNYRLIVDPEKELEAKANITYALINTGLIEFANPFVEDMTQINKYYNNSILYKVVISLKLRKFEQALNDLTSLSSIDAESINNRVLLLEAYLGLDMRENTTELVNKIIIDFKIEDEAKVIEAFKILYAYHDYEAFWKMYLGLSSKLDDNAIAVHYMAMQASVYRDEITLLPQILDQIALNDTMLNVAERSSYAAAQALVAYQNNEVNKAKSLIETSEDLYFYEPFVHYIKSIILYDSKYLERAYELDLQFEVPKKEYL